VNYSTRNGVKLHDKHNVHGGGENIQNLPMQHSLCSSLAYVSRPQLLSLAQVMVQICKYIGKKA